MIKKLFSVFAMILMVISVLGCSDSPEYTNIFSVEKDKPTFTYNDSDEITKNQVESFFDRYKDELNEAIEPCEYITEIEDSEITYEEAKEIDKSLCGSLYRIDDSYSLKNQIFSLEEIIINFVFVTDSIPASTDIEILSSRGLIDFSDDTLNYIIYNKDEPRFSQYTLAIVDGEFYYEEYNYSITKVHDETERTYYKHHIYYENNYHIRDELFDTTGREHFEMDLETSEFYYYSKSVDYPVVIFYYGNDEVINRIVYDNVDISNVWIMSTIYKDEIFSMNYITDIETDEDFRSILVFSAFELPNWDTLKGESQEFFMYNGDDIIYPEYMIHFQTTFTVGVFPAIVLEDYELEKNSLKIAGTSIDVSILKGNIDYLSNNHKDMLDEYNISLEFLPLSDYIDDFNFIDEMAEEYLD